MNGGIPPLSLFYLGATGVAFAIGTGKDPVAWMFLVFLLGHSLMARKDIRFLFPLLPLLPLIMFRPVYGCYLKFSPARAIRQSDLDSEAGPVNLNWWDKHGWKGMMRLGWSMNFVLLFYIALLAPSSEIGVCRYIYRHYTDAPLEVAWEGGNPYERFGLIMHFYQRPGLLNVAEAQEWKARGKQPTLLVVRGKTASAVPVGAQLLYTDQPAYLPAGLLATNKWWYLYALNPSPETCPPY
ncbi:MAG: hypothetical protein HC821_04175 [Lewinella sp.]|nr:hypothetical protein [Lewinella sp.]